MKLKRRKGQERVITAKSGVRDSTWCRNGRRGFHPSGRASAVAGRMVDLVSKYPNTSAGGTTGKLFENALLWIKDKDRRTHEEGTRGGDENGKMPRLRWVPHSSLNFLRTSDGGKDRLEKKKEKKEK